LTKNTNESTQNNTEVFHYIYLSTTTMGLSDPVTIIKPFHIIKAVETIIAKFKI
jgi:hypothetical protein